MTFKNFKGHKLKTIAVRILAYVQPYTPEKSPKDLGGCWIKVHEILTRRVKRYDVLSTMVLRQQSTMRSFHPLWNASAE